MAWSNIDTFLLKQQNLTTKYSDLQKNLYLLLESANGQYSLYFEDLNTGVSFGINEKEEFVPLSLLKIPTLVATLKEVELGRVSLDKIVVLNERDLDNRSGKLWEKGAGYDISIKDLMINLIKHSDNTALLTLNRQVVSDTTFTEARLAMGLSSPSVNVTTLTAKDYSNMLRGLYFSNYLRKPFSELALTLMLETDFNSQIPAGVPLDVKVAHKVGIYAFEGLYHDCGIVYAKDNPYILCIMSKNTSSKEADKIISEVSRMIYNFVSTNNLNNSLNIIK
jgi:beta-lactamase class A